MALALPQDARPVANICKTLKEMWYFYQIYPVLTTLAVYLINIFDSMIAHIWVLCSSMIMMTKTEGRTLTAQNFLA